MTTATSDEALMAVLWTLRDGQVFYEEAAKGAPSPALRQLFARMAEERERGLVKLTPYLDGPAPEDESWTNLADRLYADIQALLDDPRTVYLDKLREYEAHLLATIDERRGEVADGAARDAVDDVREACLRNTASADSFVGP